MRIRRSSSFWPGELGKMIDQFKTGDVVAFLGTNSATFHGTVLDVNAAINKVLVAWNGGGVEQHDPDEVTLHPAYAARIASRRASGETLITETSEEAEKDEDFVGDAKEHGLDTPIGGGFNIMQDLTKKLHKESVRDAASLVGRRAMYWTGPDRTFRMTKKEQESGDACCPTCKSHMDKESFTRGENLYRCPECSFKVPSSKIVTKRVVEPVEPVEPVEVFPQSPLRSVRDYVGSDDLRTRRSKNKSAKKWEGIRYNTGKPLGSADISFIKKVGKLTKLNWKMIAARPTTLQRYVLEAKDSGKTAEELVESWDTAKSHKPSMSMEKFNKKFNVASEKTAKKGEVPEAFKKQWKKNDKGKKDDSDDKGDKKKDDGKMPKELLEKFKKKKKKAAASVGYRYNTGKPLGSADIRYIKQVGKLTKLDWKMIAARPTTLQRYVLEAKDSGKTVEELVESWDTAKANKPSMSIEKFNKKFNKTAKKEVPEAFKKEWKNKDKDGDGKENEPKPDFVKEIEKKKKKKKAGGFDDLRTRRSKKKGEVPEAFKKEWKNKDKDGDGKENEPKPDFVKEIEKNKKNKKKKKSAQSGKFHRDGKDIYVDSAFLNSTRGILPGSSMEHMGFGEFYLDTPNGRVDFDRMRGKDFEGQTGRSHKITDDVGGKLVKQLIHGMQNKGVAVEV